ncbi:MAG: PQQ-binding-like beta-propeller repeat protein [Verrucomicrobiales bacterium]|nr:PQQ-binding-like beta-propeller repeat protein [Verrucomicrobiales bacterium]
MSGIVGNVRADWLQFRGPGGSGVLEAGALPAKLDGKGSIAWEAALPGEGLSSPVVVGEKVFVTCSSGAEQDRLHVFCLDSKNGKTLWERQFWATGRTMHHEKTSVAAPSPCSDGEQVYAFYSSNDLACMDLDGNVKWVRGLTVDYPNASNSLGMASSPVVAGGVVVCLVENDSESFAAGIDPKTGRNVWKVARTKRASWTSPVVFKDPTGGRELVALQGSAGLDVLDPKTGKSVWSYSDGASTTPSLTVGDGVLFVPSRGLTALELKGGSEFEKTWQKGNLGPGTASPVASKDRVYVISNAGVLSAAKVSDGEVLWKARLEGPFSGSPVLSGDRLLAVSERGGIVQLVDLTGAEGTVIGKVELGETVLSTPAVSGGAVYVRTDGKVWKLEG